MTIDIPPGTSIQDAAKQAQKLADKSGGPVTFDFNDIECIALPGGNAETLAGTQQEEQRRKRSVTSLGDVG